MLKKPKQVKFSENDLLVQFNKKFPPTNMEALKPSVGVSNRGKSKKKYRKSPSFRKIVSVSGN